MQQLVLFGNRQLLCTQAILTIAYELELESMLTLYELDETTNEHMQCDYKAITPFSRVPTLLDHVTGVKVSDVGPIALYLCTQYDKASIIPTVQDYHRTVSDVFVYNAIFIEPISKLVYLTLNRYIFALGGHLHTAPFTSQEIADVEGMRGSLKKRLAIFDAMLGQERLDNDKRSLIDVLLVTYMWHVKDMFLDGIDGLDGLPNVQRWYLRIAQAPSFLKMSAECFRS